MIVFDKLWHTMKIKGISTYKLRENCALDSRTIKRLKNNGSIETKTLDKMCEYLNCNVEDILTHINAKSQELRQN